MYDLNPKQRGSSHARSSSIVPPNHAALHTRKRGSANGSPLDAGTRTRFEPALGMNLSEVRIHCDAESAKSAADLNAEAYASGRNIFFGAGHYRPGSFAGDNLLAHELAHVAQQEHRSAPAEQESGISQPGEPAEVEADKAAESLLAGQVAHFTTGAHLPAIQRQKVGETGPGAELVVQVRDWLEKHQFAPPTDQPRDGERHILLNGQDMLLSQAVKLAADDLKVSPKEVQPIIVAALAVPRPVSARGATYVGGAGNTVPGLPLKPETHADDVKLGKAHELDTIDDWLQEHGFNAPASRDPTGAKAIFDGKDTTIEEIADRALPILGQYPYVNRQDILVHLRQKYVKAPGAAGPRQYLFGYTLIPSFAQHVSPTQSGGLPTQHQFAFTITKPQHPDYAAGVEDSAQISGTVVFDNSGNAQIANLQGGVQKAYVFPLLDGLAQVGGFAQVMGSVNWMQSAQGTMKAEPGVQGAIGVQALLTPDWKVLDTKIQIGVQAQAFTGVVGDPDRGVQFQRGANAGLVINLQR